MTPQAMIDGLLWYFCLVLLITFHEFGHAWAAHKRGDDTAKMLGRISLNPLVHIDMLGTVVLPLLSIMLQASGSGLANFIIGWGKPVPVNSANLKNRGLDWVLIAMAGPAMNILLALVSVAILKGAQLGGADQAIDFAARLALMNLFLCFFNLLPIPPLDGSHLMRYFIGMSEETFLRIGQYGFFILIVVINLPGVRYLLSTVTFFTFRMMCKLFGVGFAL